MEKYLNFIKLVKSEMKPSLGCTEPVAIGLAVSKTCSYLKNHATKIELKISSNIFKNAYCVKLPNTKESGIELAATLGFLLSKEDNDLEIFKNISFELLKEAKEILKKDFIDLKAIRDNRFYIEVVAFNSKEKVKTITIDKHDNMVRVEKNGELIFDKMEKIKNEDNQNESRLEISKFSILELIKIAEEINIEYLDFLEECIEMNLAASKEGLRKDYGVHIGRSIKNLVDKKILCDSLENYVKMTVSSASDMRMGGGPLSAMTIAGSGNQGFQTSLPIIAASKYLKLSREKKLRALFMSILIMLRLKNRLGRLSPICGAMLGGTASSAAIAWLLGGKKEEMLGAMQNMFANISGMMCDGAKDGCSIKLCTCSGEAVLSAKYSIEGVRASGSDGIVSESIEETINNIGRLSSEGMREVDMNVIDILMKKSIN